MIGAKSGTRQDSLLAFFHGPLRRHTGDFSLILTQANLGTSILWSHLSLSSVTLPLISPHLSHWIVSSLAPRARHPQESGPEFPHTHNSCQMTCLELDISGFSPKRISLRNIWTAVFSLRLAHSSAVPHPFLSIKQWNVII